MQGYAVDFRRPDGEPGLVPPDSPQWRIFRNPVALAIGGVAAVLLEFADARIRSGVWEHSTFKTDPIKRSRRTALAAMVGVFGAKSEARRIIGMVNRMHTKVVGHTPDGEPYRALDPELLDWVSATAGYGFVEAYHRFVAPLSANERARYYRDSEPIGRLYGVRTPLAGDADFFAMLDRLMPRFEPHPIIGEFLDIVMSGRAAPLVPRAAHRALGRAAVSLLPDAVRERLQLGAVFDMTRFDLVLMRSAGRIVDRIPVPGSPAWQTARRLGLPGTFAWRSPYRQTALLAASTRQGEYPRAPLS